MDGRRESLWRAIVTVPGVPGTSQWARAVCGVSVELLPGIDAAALTLRASLRAQDMLGASDEWAGQLDGQQYTLGEGPGVDAFASGEPELVTDIRTAEARWPWFCDAALAMGARAVYAFPLRIGGVRLGTLDLYRHQIGGFTPSMMADAMIVAVVISQALMQEVTRAEEAGQAWLRPVGSYHDVNVATGMLAALLRISLDDAFLRLRGRAFTTDRPLVEVAKEVLEKKIDVDELY
ncbi:GAF domain-containing protein [Nocardia tenerifensis]|uniref:GAF domain-containing protein n=1 Tax=Nocardia tenerifensis TaxID=228006 RepID=A0A318JWL2_9NOCA|nr:GAF and ANTAR domain-containing protein [Nocardia tenerifensis]PXX61670.1 GAF domain-containing protein [Nocardia tenerifensis]